ncbi:MAG: hypothetical protein LBD30_05275 [Verrucomicrobiales bacterium]|jgi:hypothetical protein|nr:hypothetical protein [Verrucomicrobiales bacterium]
MNTVWIKIKPWLGLACVFLIGALVGSALTVTMTQKHFRAMVRNGPPPRSAEIVLKKLSRDLELSEQQRAVIAQILKNGTPLIFKANRDRDAAMKKIFEDTRGEIRAVLNPDQQARYDEMMRRIAERWERRRH